MSAKRKSRAPSGGRGSGPKVVMAYLWLGDAAGRTEPLPLLAFITPASRLVSSTGTTNFVDGELPICFRVSKYCNVIVVESKSPATSRIRRSAAA